MRKPRAKLSWEGGDVAPFPRSPASLGEMGMIERQQVCPLKTVSSEGCSRGLWEQLEEHYVFLTALSATERS